jgi:anaerobic selenocysteine-containing dehydrogenase
MGTVRRDFLKLAGGLSAGIVFTPVPWKILDDVSIWTQNWGWIPRPLRGEITQSYTNCTLCPAGCGVRASCVAGQPYQLAGIANHPVGRPTLCPAGLAAHQLPYAAARVTEPTVNGKTTTLDASMAAAAVKISAAESVLVLDGRPGRCASEMYRRVASGNPKWRYVTAPGSGGALRAYAKLTGMSAGVDWERAQTVLSCTAGPHPDASSLGGKNSG